jgi:hypothetical protein
MLYSCLAAIIFDQIQSRAVALTDAKHTWSGQLQQPLTANPDKKIIRKGPSAMHMG